MHPNESNLFWQMNTALPPLGVMQCKQKRNVKQGTEYRIQDPGCRCRYSLLLYGVQWGQKYPRIQVNQRKMFAVNAIAIFLSRISAPFVVSRFLSFVLLSHCCANLLCFLLHSTKSVCNMRFQTNTKIFPFSSPSWGPWGTKARTRRTLLGIPQSGDTPVPISAYANRNQFN